MVRIKVILILESEIEELFLNFCNYIHSITKDVECIYNVNKNYISLRNNLNIQKNRSIAYFKIKKFKTLVLLWKTLKTWSNLASTPIFFNILAIRKNVSYLEFKNDQFERYDYNKDTKPLYFNIYFSKFPKKNKTCIPLK